MLLQYSQPVDGFELAYHRDGAGRPVVMIHGSPGDHREYERLIPLVRDHADVLVPDLRGFGKSSKPADRPLTCYSRFAQASSVAALMDQLGLREAILVGYDIGGFTAQILADQRPDLVAALVLAPPLPGAGRRILHPGALREFWHATLYQTQIVEDVLDGDAAAIRVLLQGQIHHWQGPDSHVVEALVDHLVATLSAPGAFTASIAWFRNADGNPISAFATELAPPPPERLTIPTTVLWPDSDPLFPLAWADCLDDFFTDYELHQLAGCGHFAPFEAPGAFAHHIRARLTAAPGCLNRADRDDR